MLDHREDVRNHAHEENDLAFGTVESWIAYVSGCVSGQSCSLSRVPAADRLFAQNLLGSCESQPEFLWGDQRVAQSLGQHADFPMARGPHACALLRHLGLRPACASSRRTRSLMVPSEECDDQQGALINNNCPGRRWAKCTCGIPYKRVLAVLHRQQY